VSEKSRDLYGKQLEILGNYDPVANPKTVNLKEDRIKHWISVGAQPSPTVHNILVTNKIIEAKKVQAWKPKKKKEEKVQGSKDKVQGEEKKEGEVQGSSDEVREEEKKEKKPDESEKKEEEPKSNDKPAEDKKE
jgi:small subunit ribosomal protein S16